MESFSARPNHQRGALLVFNYREAWVNQLSALDYDLDIVVGLHGRYKRCWDEQIRPVPPNARLITLTEARLSHREYDCIITHSISDLLDIKNRTEPRITVLHLPVEARLSEEQTPASPDELVQALHQYLSLIGGHAVAVTELKGRSWGLTEDIVHDWADPVDYSPFRGELAQGLRIANFFPSWRQYLLWDLQDRAFADIPVQVVGRNPQMAGFQPSPNWDHIKELLASHRFYIYTADPALEDGFDSAMLEAMAAGMPVLGNRHPGSPVEHGLSGFLSDDPAELNRFARELLANQPLAVHMGQQAQATIQQKFGKDRFRRAFLRSIEQAQLKCRTRRAAPNIISST
jgi:glycosyltransferase involved in cell wall biosynthesis